jgi:hypothetical protein
MVIDVVVFTPSAPVWHIQGHSLHPYIMLDATVPWFDPNIPIDREATATVAAAAATAVATTTVTAAALVAAALARRRDATINGRRRDKFMA